MDTRLTWTDVGIPPDLHQLDLLARLHRRLLLLALAFAAVMFALTPWFTAVPLGLGALLAAASGLWRARTQRTRPWRRETPVEVTVAVADGVLRRTWREGSAVRDELELRLDEVEQWGLDGGSDTTSDTSAWEPWVLLRGRGYHSFGVALGAEGRRVAAALEDVFGTPPLDCRLPTTPHPAARAAPSDAHRAASRRPTA